MADGIAGHQACWEERLNNNTASEWVYRSWEIFGVKEEDEGWRRRHHPDDEIQVVLPQSVETNFPRGTNNQKYTQIWLVIVICIGFLRSFVRRYFAGKQVVASLNVGCFLRLYIVSLSAITHCMDQISSYQPLWALLLQHYSSARSHWPVLWYSHIRPPIGNWESLRKK